jgi:signal transduction histidine kinase
MSAILTGKMRIEKTHVSLVAVLSESVETMRSRARESKVQLNLTIADSASALTVIGDRSRLSQTFCNILHNAIKFSPAGSEVQIGCAASGSEAAVRIADRGEGITAEFLPHVFERFRQEDGSRSRAHGGLGLGLALVKSFVSAHAGTIEAMSDGAGKGSTFIVRLPQAAKPTTENSRQQPQVDSDNKTNGPRVLIVEDQPDTLEMLSAQFSVRGYDVLPCTSAAEADRRTKVF